MELDFRKTVFFISFLIVFAFSTLASWYEGAQILDNPFEWKHSAIFSNWLNGEVVMAEDILTIDYFVYALKFAPTFPFLMIVSAFLIVLQIFSLILKGREMGMSLFFGVVAIGSLTVAALLSSSPTKGLTLFSILFGALGIASIAYIFLHTFKRKKGDTPEICP